MFNHFLLYAKSSWTLFFLFTLCSFVNVVESLWWCIFEIWSVTNSLRMTTKHIFIVYNVYLVSMCISYFVSLFMAFFYRRNYKFHYSNRENYFVCKQACQMKLKCTKNLTFTSIYILADQIWPQLRIICFLLHNRSLRQYKHANA